MAALTARSLRVPGDKSISHRALIIGALAKGTSRVRGILCSDDVRSTAAVLRALGVELSSLGELTHVRGTRARQLAPPDQSLDCGNSGTTARLMAGVLAAQAFESRLVGDYSLSRRPMRRVTEPLSRMGAAFRFEGTDGTLPLVVQGSALRPIEWESETASAQVKSAILLAGVAAGVRVVVSEPAASRDHTERMLVAAGAQLIAEPCRVALEGQAALDPIDATVPGDPSSAAFLAAFAALRVGCAIEVRDVGLNATRTGFFGILSRMGAPVDLEQERVEGGEPVGTVRVESGELAGVSVGAAHVPSMIDELPLLACVASRADGETVIGGAGELRVKESDRISRVVSNLRAIGADAEEMSDGMRVRGNRTPLRGRVHTDGDHRIAMAFGVLAALPGNHIEIDDPACVRVSYPDYWRDLAAVAG